MEQSFLNEQFIHKLSIAMDAGAALETESGIEEYGVCANCFNITNNDKILHVLREETKGKTPYYLYLDEKMVYYFAIRFSRGLFFAGPMLTTVMNREEIKGYIHRHGMKEKPETGTRLCTLESVLAGMMLISSLFCDREYTQEELLEASNLTDTTVEMNRNLVMARIDDDENERAHHSYMDEQKLMQCIMAGEQEEALRLTYEMDAYVGKLSDNVRNNWKNMAVAQITLCVRAAISGGLFPALGYRLSDYYIQQVDQCKELGQIFLYRDKAIKDLCENVREHKDKHKLSSYVDKCVDYIDKHYREKIYVADIAEGIGISAGYLSKLFYEEMGEHIQDFVVRTRIEHTKNLLLYSNESLSSIAAYVCFPSQSYLGEKFKRYTGMTPNQFRKSHETAEFAEKYKK